MKNEEVFEVLDKILPKIDDIDSRTQRLNRQQQDLNDKLRRIGEDIYCLRKSIDSLIIYDKELTTIAKRIDLHELDIKTVIDSNKAYEEGFADGRAIRDSTEGKDIAKQIYDTIRLKGGL